MLQLRSQLIVGDNTMALATKCIKVYDKQRYGCIGDYILVSVKSLKEVQETDSSDTKITIGQTRKGLIVLTKKSHKHYDGMKIQGDENVIILVEKAVKTKEWLPLSTRIMSPIVPVLKDKNLGAGKLEALGAQLI
eukprot:Opistho-2@25519